MVIIAGGEGGTPKEKINGHRQILAASSDIFKAMLYGPFVEGSTRELTIPNIEPDIMRALLTFIYTGNVNVEVEKIVSIIKAVDQYCIRGAREEFEKAALYYIDQATGMSEKQIEYVLRLMQDSSTTCGGIESLLSATLRFIEANTTSVIMS